MNLFRAKKRKVKKNARGKLKLTVGEIVNVMFWILEVYF